MCWSLRFSGVDVLLIFVCILSTGCPPDQGPDSGVTIPEGTTVWAARAGGASIDSGSAVDALPDGGCVLTGHFSGTATFTGAKAVPSALISTGLQDILVARYGADGSAGWAVRAGGTGDDRGTAIASFSNETLVVTGYFEGQAVFGEGESRRTVLQSAGQQDAFLARYGYDGRLLWATSAGGEGADKGLGMAPLSDGSCIVVGTYTGNPTFGAGMPAETVLPQFGETDIFIAKYNPFGFLVWARWAAGQGADGGYGVAALPDGAFLVAGGFSGACIFGADEPNQTVLRAYGSDDEDSPTNTDVFLARYNADGSLAWAKRAGGPGNDTAYAIAALPDGTSFVTGTFEAAALFGPAEGTQTTLRSAGAQDVFVARYNTLGNLVWAGRSGGGSADSGFTIAALENGGCAVAGSFRQTCTFASATGTAQTTKLSTGEDDIFVASYSSLGGLEWVIAAGGIGADCCHSIATAESDRLLGTGQFAYTVMFPSEGSGDTAEKQANGDEVATTEPNQDIALTSMGGIDLFVAGYAPPSESPAEPDTETPP